MYAELKRKVCRQCSIEKSIELFRFRKLKRTFESYCKECESQNNKMWYQANAASLKEKDFARNCKRFGITVEEYEIMQAAQDNKCAICRLPETSTRAGIVKRLAIDHDHKTNKVRNLLCHGCNTAIGLVYEDTSVLEAAVSYLNKFKK